jgi:hypothetical protein
MHFTSAGKKAAARGIPTSEIAYNAIFRPI